MGLLKVDSKYSAVLLNVHKFRDIVGKIIPQIGLYPLKGVKKLDYADFCKIATLMSEHKAHLTIDGLNQIKIIKSGMNTGRK